jgi:hypothetical protein
MEIIAGIKKEVLTGDFHFCLILLPVTVAHRTETHESSCDLNEVKFRIMILSFHICPMFMSFDSFLYVAQCK